MSTGSEWQWTLAPWGGSGESLDIVGSDWEWDGLVPPNGGSGYVAH